MVSADEICALLAGTGNTPLSAVALSQFVRAGMPKLARGQYDPVACLAWYVGVLRASLKNAKHGVRQNAAAALGFLN